MVERYGISGKSGKSGKGIRVKQKKQIPIIVYSQIKKIVGAGLAPARGSAV